MKKFTRKQQRKIIATANGFCKIRERYYPNSEFKAEYYNNLVEQYCYYDNKKYYKSIIKRVISKRVAMRKVKK